MNKVKTYKGFCIFWSGRVFLIGMSHPAEWDYYQIPFSSVAEAELWIDENGEEEWRKRREQDSKDALSVIE